MSHEENKKHSLEDLRNQSISGSDVLGGGSGDLNITEDFSTQGGNISEGAIMDSKPLDQDPLGMGNSSLGEDTVPVNINGPINLGPPGANI